MDAAAVVAIISAATAALIAITVPFMAFRLALRQDQARWLRDRRADLYVDLLAEAQAESHYLEYALADDQTRHEAREFFNKTDTRLPPPERARLGARGTVFASQDVNRLFNELGAAISRALLTPRAGEAQAIVTRVQAGSLLDQLQAAVRRELGADAITLEGPRQQPQNKTSQPPLNPGHPPRDPPQAPRHSPQPQHEPQHPAPAPGTSPPQP